MTNSNGQTTSNGKNSGTTGKSRNSAPFGWSIIRGVSLLVLILAVLIGVVNQLHPPPRQELVVLGRAHWTALQTALPVSVFQALTRFVAVANEKIRAALGWVTVEPFRLASPPFFTLNEIWTGEELQALTKMVQEISSFPGLTRDQTSLLEHIGEGRPINADGSCSHPYLIPNLHRNFCVLATRLDVGHHYISSGGPSGLKEPMQPLLARTLSFSKFFISNPLSAEKQKDVSSDGLNAAEMPALKSLFQSKSYLDASKSVCNGLSVLDPFQLGVILQLPGQQLGVHLDVPWFFGANRFHFPQWLLVVMRGSGIWESRAVRQVQGVAYLHEWDVLPGETTEQFAKRNGGAFQFWPSPYTTEPQLHYPVKNSAIVLDGSLIPHGTAMFRPAEQQSLPSISRNSSSTLNYVPPANGKTAKWSLQVDGKSLATYEIEQVRISLVWRAMCFASVEERDRYHSPDQSINPDLPLDEILRALKADLVKKGYTPPEDALDLAVMLLDVYVDYPWPSKIIPFNYCMIPSLLGDAIRYIAC